MDEEANNKLILVFCFVVIALIISSVGSCRSAAKQKELFIKQRESMIKLESEAVGLSKENEGLKQEITKLREALNQQTAIYQTTKEKFDQEISRLEDELERLTILKKKIITEQ